MKIEEVIASLPYLFNLSLPLTLNKASQQFFEMAVLKTSSLKFPDFGYGVITFSTRKY